MKSNGAERVESLTGSALSEEWIEQIERNALSRTAPLLSAQRSPALDAHLLDLRASTAAARMALLRRKLFLTLREAAEYSGLPLSSIRRLLARNLLPAVKLGGWRIKRSYLEMLAPRHLRRLAKDRAERTKNAPARRTNE